MAVEKLGFKAEVKQLLHLLAHSMYSNKEVAFRELISNASDAEDKFRLEALKDESLYEDDKELKIWLEIDKDNRQVRIRDNGIGFSKKELVDNLGTIAKSGTREFIDKLGKSDSDQSSNLIGQFGVGFYSAFVVADQVTVETRRAGSAAGKGHRWVSDGTGEFTIEPIKRAERGTTIILHLKESEDEFLDAWRLQQIVRTYADHIAFPIVMMKEVTVEQEGESEADSKADAETVLEEEVVNQAKALWTLPKSEITKQQYIELYKHVSHDFDEPLLWAHNQVEGKHTYTTLLYIPKHAPMDLWNRDKPRGLKLYVQRVFIMDDAEQFLPMYLRFVKGIVDTNDLPLNVSRELLQSNKINEVIKSGCVKRILNILEKMAADDGERYQQFWDAFGAVLKEGPGEDFGNKERIAKLLRFASTDASCEGHKQTVSLQDYLSRMQDGQDKIYYVTAETPGAAASSPHLEYFRKKGYEVLLLSDRVDEWLMAHLTEFDGKAFQSITRGELELDEEEDQAAQESKQKLEKDLESVLKQVTEVLDGKVKEVRLSSRLTDSPSCVVSDENEMSSNLKRMLKEAGQDVPDSQPILELNGEHPHVQHLKDVQDDSLFEDWANVLLSQAKLAEGDALTDPADFVRRMNRLLAVAGSA